MKVKLNHGKIQKFGSQLDDIEIIEFKNPMEFSNYFAIRIAPTIRDRELWVVCSMGHRILTTRSLYQLSLFIFPYLNEYNEVFIYEYDHKDDAIDLANDIEENSPAEVMSYIDESEDTDTFKSFF
jgi:hypothetical protein